MQSRWFYLLGILALIAIPVIAAYCIWIVRTVAVSRFRSSIPGQIIQQYDHVAPLVKERDKAVEELTRP